MTLLGLLPLAFGLGACAAVGLSAVSRRVDRTVTRLALGLFGSHVERRAGRRSERRLLLQSARVGSTYREYASKTWLYTAIAAVVGSVLGVYLVAGALAVLALPPDAMRSTLPAQFAFLANLLVHPQLSPGELLALLAVSSATLGLLAGASTYQLRWAVPKHRADTRARQIDESLPRTVAFVYALSRSGMAFPEILRVLSRNRDVYGEAAAETEAVVKAVDLFGLDVLTAIEQTARQSPSDTFEEFAKNLASVLQSGRSVSEYLDDQYERYREDARVQQERFLELLATLAEAYVSLFVVGPLLLITILAVAGLMNLGDTLPFLRALTYVVIPLGSVGFIVYLDGITESLRVSRSDGDLDLGGGLPSSVRRVGDPGAGRERTTGEASTARGDGGDDPVGRRAANFERLSAFDRFRRVRDRLADPLRTAVERPVTLLYLIVPLAAASILVRGAPLLSANSFDVRAFDDIVVQAGLFVLASFSVVQEIRRRRIRAIERAVPDLLDRLASVNEAGMTIVECIRQVAEGDVGALDDEIERVRADVRGGANVGTALRRLEGQVRIPTVTRVVTLITGAMRASGDLARVLRIAADDARSTRRLKRKRRQEMLTYVMIIYLAFLVFLVIVGSLDAVMIPNLPTGGSAPSGGAGFGGAGNVSDVNAAAYELLFFHTALVQALFSGLIAGKMGEESVKNGARHAAVLVTITYVAFLALG